MIDIVVALGTVCIVLVIVAHMISYMVRHGRAVITDISHIKYLLRVTMATVLVEMVGIFLLVVL